MNITPNAPLKNGKIAKKFSTALTSQSAQKQQKCTIHFEFLEYKKALSYVVFGSCISKTVHHEVG